MVTSQSSNSALSVVPACPRKVISYVFDCTRSRLPGLALVRGCLQHAARSVVRNRPLGGDPRFGSGFLRNG
jgi:hypothetical protein